LISGKLSASAETLAREAAGVKCNPRPKGMGAGRARNALCYVLSNLNLKLQDNRPAQNFLSEKTIGSSTLLW
jgi:hypothetical protein